MIRAVFLFLLVFIVGFRQPPETWYVAQMIDSGAIVAFTMDGDIRETSVKGDWQYAMRIDSETILLAVAPEGERTTLYRVTPDGGTKITAPESDGDFRQALAFSNPYIVLRQHTSVVPTPTLLVNTATARAELLTGMLPAVARISADGARLRYMSADGDNWSLIERTLETGAERIVGGFTTDNPLPLVSADAHGDRWLYDYRDASNTVGFNLLSIDGEQTQLDSGTREQPVRWSFLGDALIGVPLRCGDNCDLSLVTGEMQYSLPLPIENIYSPLAAPNANSLLTLDSYGDYWLLQADAAPRLVGQYDATLLFMPAHQLVSPDGRYVLAGASEDRYAVWDLTTYTPVVTLDAKYIGLILYSAYGFLIHSYGDDTDTGLAYRYASGETLALPHTDVGLYFDLLPDDTIVYMLQKADESIGEPGIYRYDPAAETYTSVLPGALLTYPQSLG